MAAPFTLEVARWAAVVVLVCGCGDDGGSRIDAGPSDGIDANTGVVDAANGVVCSNAVANYPGVLQNPAASDDGQALLFFADIDAVSPPDRLRLSIDEGAAQKLGTFELPDEGWSVSLCLDDSDGSCTDALVVFSGTLRVDSVTERFKANLDRTIFVDDLDEPSCSASLTQASVDVAIDALP